MFVRCSSDARWMFGGFSFSLDVHWISVRELFVRFSLDARRMLIGRSVDFRFSVGAP